MELTSAICDRFRRSGNSPSTIRPSQLENYLSLRGSFSYAPLSRVSVAKKLTVLRWTALIFVWRAVHNGLCFFFKSTPPDLDLALLSGFPVPFPPLFPPSLNRPAPPPSGAWGRPSQLENSLSLRALPPTPLFPVSRLQETLLPSPFSTALCPGVVSARESVPAADFQTHPSFTP